MLEDHKVGCIFYKYRVPIWGRGLNVLVIIRNKMCLKEYQTYSVHVQKFITKPTFEFGVKMNLHKFP